MLRILQRTRISPQFSIARTISGGDEDGSSDKSSKLAGNLKSILESDSKSDSVNQLDELMRSIKTTKTESELKTEQPKIETKNKKDLQSESEESSEKNAADSSSASNLMKQLKNTDETTSKLDDLLKSIKFSSAIGASNLKIDLAKPQPLPKHSKKLLNVIEKSQGKDEKLVTAAQHVSHEIGGGLDTQSELIDSLLMLEQNSDELRPDFNAALSGMKVEQSVEKDSTQFERSSMHQERRPPRSSFEASIHSGDKLNIFKSENFPPQTKVKNSTWMREHNRDVAFAQSQHPESQYQEMMQWTDEGKIWQFPIDNEFGLEEEKKVGFHEHIFLDRHLQGWCPRVGPVRHFMELICIALSKNPHMTVERKRSIISWYREFFDKKRTQLEDIGAYSKSENRA